MKIIAFLIAFLAIASAAFGESTEKELKIEKALAELAKNLATQAHLLSQMAADLPKSEQLLAIQTSGNCDTIALGLVILKAHHTTIIQSPSADPKSFNLSCDLVASHSKALAEHTARAVALAKSPGYLGALRETHKLFLDSHNEARDAKK